MLGGYGTCGRPLCCTTFLHVVRAGLDQDGQAAGPEPEPVEAVRPVRPAEVLPALRAAEREGRRTHGGLRQRRRLRQSRGCGIAAVDAAAAAAATPDAGSRRANCRISNLQSPSAHLQSEMPMTRPRIAITAGDPAGIGPEIAARAAADPRVLDVCEPMLYGAAGRRSVRAGRAERRGRAARRTTRSCARSATRSAASSHAIATAPVNKEAFRLAGLPWSGHTDLLAHLTGAAPRRDDVLLRRAPRRAGHRAHPAGRRAARAHARTSLEPTIALTARELPRFGFAGAANRRGGAQSARRRARAVRPRGRDGDRARDRRVPGARHRRVRAVSRRHACSCAPAAASSTSSSRAITTRGSFRSSCVAFGAGGERDARAADRADVGRSRHGVRHRRAGRRRSREHGRGRAPGGEAGAAGGRVRRTVMTERKTEREKAQTNIAENRKAFHDFHLLETFEAGIVAARHRGEGDPRGARQPARQLRARRGRRGVPLQREHQPLQPPRLRRSRAAAPAQAAAAPRRNPQARSARPSRRG